MSEKSAELNSILPPYTICEGLRGPLEKTNRAMFLSRKGKANPGIICKMCKKVARPSEIRKGYCYKCVNTKYLLSELRKNRRYVEENYE